MPQCHLKDIKPKHEWYINKIQLTQTKRERSNDQDSATNKKQNTSGSNLDSTITSRSSSKRIGWSNLHYNLSNCRRNKGNVLKDLVLLDSDSTNTIFCNKDYVENVREAETPLEIQTNGGTLTVTQICEIQFLGIHWFNKGAVTNIISLADLSKNYRVTMDTAKE